MGAGGQVYASEAAMFYLADIGYVSQDGEDKDSGAFIVLAEAGDPESATEKIQKVILQARSRGGFYPGTASFTVGSIIEIEKVPEPGLLCFYRQFGDPDGELFGSVGIDLPPASESDGVGAFIISEDDDPDVPMGGPFFVLEPND